MSVVKTIILVLTPNTYNKQMHIEATLVYLASALTKWGQLWSRKGERNETEWVGVSSAEILSREDSAGYRRWSLWIGVFCFVGGLSSSASWSSWTCLSVASKRSSITNPRCGNGPQLMRTSLILTYVRIRMFVRHSRFLVATWYTCKAPASGP